jgi:hypothetical protein
MTSPTQQPQTAPRQRVAGVAQVDVAHASAAGQLALTIHVDLERSNGSSSVETRPIPPAGFKRAIAAAVDAVVNELMPYPSEADVMSRRATAAKANASADRSTYASDSKS